MDKIKFGKGWAILLTVTLLVTACDQIQPTQKYTLKGTPTKTPFQIKATYTATSEPPPTLPASDTPTASSTATSTEETTLTPSATDTATTTASVTSSAAPDTATPVPPTASSPENLTIKVSLTTNCRTGPGVTYPKLTPLQAGRVVPLIGRDHSYSYWIIKDPGKTGRDCWLWGYYATTTGDTRSLPVYSAPDQPTLEYTATPTSTFTPSNTNTPRPSATPRTPLPTHTPNLTPATWTHTPLPPTATLIPSSTPTPSDTPVPSNTPIPSNTPQPSNTPLPKFCAYTSPLPSEEQQIMDLINQARRDAGLNTLSPLTPLINAARDHGQDMTCNGVYSHTSTDGTRAWERIGTYVYGQSNWCYTHCCCGEIYYGGSSYLTPAHAFNWWMTHPQDPLPTWCDEGNEHKCTILGEWYTHIGVGVVQYEYNGVIRKFYTVDFVRY